MKEKNLTQKLPHGTPYSQQRRSDIFWQFCQSARHWKYCTFVLHELFDFVHNASEMKFYTYISTEQVCMRSEFVSSVVQQTWGEGQVPCNGAEFESSYYCWKKPRQINIEFTANTHDTQKLSYEFWMIACPCYQSYQFHREDQWSREDRCR